jgi:2,4-dienoyl-CoA reductase-like NADH-dependent reductase (Old Yellow Enzyme family)
MANYALKGGFGLTMTCASHVQKIGRAFPGQMGIFSDDHINNLKRLTDEIRSNKSVSITNYIMQE